MNFPGFSAKFLNWEIAKNPWESNCNDKAYVHDDDDLSPNPSFQNLKIINWISKVDFEVSKFHLLKPQKPQSPVEPRKFHSSDQKNLVRSAINNDMGVAQTTQN